MTAFGRVPTPASPLWLARAVESSLERVRTHALLNPGAAEEERKERSGHPVDRNHRPHLLAALDWLARAQDAADDGGVARGYSLTWNTEFRARGWQPPCPEPTGLVVAILHQAARDLERADLGERGARAARWSLAVQKERGVLRHGVIRHSVSPAVFHTGQVVLGWLAACRATGAGLFASAARRGARYLGSALEGDGPRSSGEQRWIHLHDVLRRARAAWALAQAGTTLDAPEFTAAAAQQLRTVADQQREDGWFAERAAFGEHRRPLLHEIASAIRGLLEGASLLGDDRLVGRAALAAEGVASAVQLSGRLPGRLAEHWRPAASWSCLSGQAQMATVWLRLHEITGEDKWLAPVSRVLRFLKSTQNRDSRDPGLRGGIKGSSPVSGAYGKFQTLSWATALFVEALLHHERLAIRRAVGREVRQATAAGAV